MHPNPIFRKTNDDRALEWAVAQSFGSLAINGDAGPVFAHIPFSLNEDGTQFEAHLVRSNPILRMIKDGPVFAVMVVQGGDAYISPDWYGVKDQVPTWNYVSVHLRGNLRILPDSALRGVLERLSGVMEARLLPKPIWTMDKMSDDALSRMLRQIVPIAMDVSDVDSTFKLSQNKSDDVRLRASDALEMDGFGVEYKKIAKLMKSSPE